MMKSRKIRALCLAMLLVLPLCLLSCGGETPADPTSGAEKVSAGRLLSGTLSSGKFSSPDVIYAMGEAAFSDRLGLLYRLSPDQLADGAFSISSTGMCADEVTILKGKDASSDPALLDALQTHVKEEIGVYSGYSPADVAKLQNALLYKEGGYVILIVSDRATEMQSLLSAYLADPASLPAWEPVEKTSEKTSEKSSEAVSAASSSAASEQVSEQPVEPSSEPVSSGEESDKTSDKPVEPVENGVWYDPTAVGESEAKPGSWANGALMIGDSRLDDLVNYLGLTPAGDYTYTSLSASAVFTKNLVNGGTIAEAVRAGKAFERAYLCFGFNELGWSAPTVFIENYAKVVELVRQVNPNATVYIVNLYPVTAAHSAKSLAEHDDLNENNDRVRQYNEMISKMAADKGCKLVNAAEAVADEGGALPEALTNDATHLNVEGIQKLWQYMLTHT